MHPFVDGLSLDDIIDLRAWPCEVGVPVADFTSPAECAAQFLSDTQYAFWQNEPTADQPTLSYLDCLLDVQPLDALQATCAHQS